MSSIKASGGNIMNNDVEKYLKKVERKNRFWENCAEGSILFSGIMGGMTAIALIMGGAGHVCSELSINDLEYCTSQNKNFQSMMEDQRADLDAQLQNGSMTQEEYDKALIRLDAYDHCVDFAINSNDKALVEKAEAYISTKDFTDSVLKKGFPSFATITTAGLGAYAISEAFRKKYHKNYIQALAQGESSEGMEK